MGSIREAAARPSDPGEVEEIRQAINRRLNELLAVDGRHGGTIPDAMRSGTLMAGKRIRPVLLVLTARGLDCETPALLDLGCAVEMVHSASLILDDLPCMDDARIRRGQPSLHLRFGEDVATLASVALLVKAFGVVSSVPGISPEVRLRMNQVLAEAVGSQGLVQGQYEDLHEAVGWREERDIVRTNDLKTASLFRAAVQIGGLTAGAAQPVLHSLAAFASDIGQAFQLFDDLNDDHPCSGKDPGQDQGKVTLRALLGEQGARQRLATHLHRASVHLATVYGPEQAITSYVRNIFDDLEASLFAGLAGRPAPVEGAGVPV